MSRYLWPALEMPAIYLYRDPVDFRKSFRGLAAIVEQELGHNPFDGALYAFTNRRRNEIKCLYWEDNGFVLYNKSLAEEQIRRSVLARRRNPFNPGRSPRSRRFSLLSSLSLLSR